MLCIHFYLDLFWTSSKYLKFKIILVIDNLNFSEHVCNLFLFYPKVFLLVRILDMTALLSLFICYSSYT